MRESKRKIPRKSANGRFSRVHFTVVRTETETRGDDNGLGTRGVAIENPRPRFHTVRTLAVFFFSICFFFLGFFLCFFPPPPPPLKIIAVLLPRTRPAAGINTVRPRPPGHSYTDRSADMKTSPLAMVSVLLAGVALQVAAFTAQDRTGNGKSRVPGVLASDHIPTEVRRAFFKRKILKKVYVRRAQRNRHVYPYRTVSGIKKKTARTRTIRSLVSSAGAQSDSYFFRFLS